MNDRFELGSYFCRDAEGTIGLATELGRRLQSGDVVALCGDLGSGKTTWTKGVALGMGLADAASVASPTYVLEHVYPTEPPLYHYDVYRLASVAEFEDIGFSERLRENPVIVVEWADTVHEAIPDRALWIEFRLPLTGDGRSIAFSTSPESAPGWGARLSGFGRSFVQG